MGGYRKMKRMWTVLFALMLLGACGDERANREEAVKPHQTGTPQTLTVLAGSEVKDLEPYLDQVREATGCSMEMHYSGTLDGFEKILSGEPYDLAWFPNAKYLALQQGSEGRMAGQEKIMLSPVVLGVKTSKAREFGWIDNPAVTWQDIARKAVSGELRFAMTNPAASNSGFSAVIGLAAAMTGKGEAIAAEDVKLQQLTEFYQGQKLTAGSSGWLADSFVREQRQLDAMINYESVLMSLNESGVLQERLVLIYPKEGILTADYPLILLDKGKREAFDRIVAHLKSPEFQRIIMTKTYRRPVNPNVPLSADFPKNLMVEVPFPNSASVIDAILLGYLNEQRIPARSYFILDVSGSMAGQRLEQLKQAMRNLAGEDTSLTGRFALFQNREKVSVITFAEKIRSSSSFDLTRNRTPQLDHIRSMVAALEPGGGTAIYSTLMSVFDQALEDRRKEPDRFYSIVLMTDGKNTVAPSLDAFENYYMQLDESMRKIRVFPIFFGEANEQELERIAALTGGRLFDGNKKSLPMVFKEIRGYQ